MMVKSPNARAMSLSELSFDFIEWYNTIFKPNKFSTTDINKFFKASSLSNSLVKRNPGTYFLVNHRIKKSIEELPLEGETALLKPDQD